MEIDIRRKNRMEQQAANNIDKIIRIEEANSLNYGHLNQQSDRVRAQPNPLKRDEMQSTFWKNINNIYFSKIKESDLEIIDFIRDTFMSDTINPLGGIQTLYADRESRETIQSLLTENYENMFSEEKTQMNKLNLSNLLKHYFCTIRLYLPILNSETSTYPVNNDYQKAFEEVYKFKSSYKVPKSNTGSEMSEYLKDESKVLDKALKCLDKCTSEDDMKQQKEIDSYQIQLAAINKINMDQVEKVLEKIVDSSDELSTDQLMSTSQYSRKIRSEYHRAGERLSLERLYLRNIIYYLEHRQISESIRYIKDVYNFADNNKYYEVLFDESVTKSTVLLEEQYIKSINRQRELNILGIHSAAHKSIKPFYSHNFMGNNEIQKPNFEYQNDMKLRDFMDESYAGGGRIGHDMMENGVSNGRVDHNSSSKKKKTVIRDKANKVYNMCHHCKSLQPDGYFIGCQRKYTLFTDIKSNIKNGFLGFRNGCEISCSMKYCRNCMKLCYNNLYKDYNYNQSCPFCEEICFCSRCQTRDTLVKQVSIYESLGGDSHALLEESPINQLVDRIIKSDKQNMFYSIMKSNTKHQINKDNTNKKYAKKTVEKDEDDQSNQENDSITMQKKKRGPKTKKYKNGYTSNTNGKTYTVSDSEKLFKLNSVLNYYGIQLSLTISIKEREELKYAHFKINNELFFKRVDMVEESLKNGGDNQSSTLGKRRLPQTPIKLKKLERHNKDNTNNTMNSQLNNNDLEKENLVINHHECEPPVEKKIKKEIASGGNNNKKHKSEISRLMKDYNPNTLKLYEELKNTKGITLRSKKNNQKT